MPALAESSDLARVNVYNRLRSEILSCALRPGRLLQERELAERYEVSKSPVRDALLRLEEQNLIQVLPRRGYRVVPISTVDVRELYDMRAILERECAIRLLDGAPDTALARLDAYRAAPLSKDLMSWIAYNRAFHITLAESCGNSRLAKTTREVIEQFDRMTVVSVTYDQERGPDLSRFEAEHAAIIDALQGRDRRTALALIKSHVEGSRRRTLHALDSMAVVA
jgi:DNA-binding GntR family transcriptional regulator